jgi:ketosteroid isomerase-like protein
MEAEQIAHLLLELEQERCQCLVEQRYERLANLLSDRLIHTHTRGNHDDKAAYLSFVGSVIESLELKRESLKVIVLDDSAAVMHGKQVNRARKRGEDGEVRVESTVTQTWAREADGQWRVVAFHASPIGPLPPPVR